jgi:hypothetical protein
LTRTKVFVAVGLVAAVIVTVCIVFVVAKRPSDCDTVRSMIDHNNQFNEHVESATAAAVEVDISEFLEWASQLDHLARQVQDPALAEQTGRLANLAHKHVGVVEQFRAAPAPDENSAAPQWAKDFSRFGQQFNTTLATLVQSCPA